MYKKKFKHSILIVCYNQRQYLDEMLQSLLTSENIPYEIIISDDCSTDGSQEILREYHSRYPEIIKLILRDKNVGITNNLNGLYNEPSGDIISFIAGDDYISPKLLEAIDIAVSNSGLNPQLDKLLSLPLVANLYPNKTLRYFDNNLIWTNPNIKKISLAVRHKIITQNVGISAALFKIWPHFDLNSFEDIGIYSDFPIYVKVATMVDYFIQVKDEYAVHRCDVGITSKENKIKNRLSYNLAAKKIINEFNLDKIDKNYLNYEIIKNELYEYKSFYSFIKYLISWIKTIFIEKINKKDIFKDLIFTLKKSSRIHIILNK